MIPAYPKIFTLGQKYIANIFDGPVEITEKIDGSQFAFGVLKGQLHVRSKGQEFPVDAPPDMFKFAVEAVEQRAHLLDPDIIYYGEYLNKPKHNVLAYSRVPNGNIALFGAMNVVTLDMLDYDGLWVEADFLGVDVVQKLQSGQVENVHELAERLLDTESQLGGVPIEGFVVKRYVPCMVGGMLLPVMAGKFVSEKFKEVHRKSWKAENTGRGKWDTYKEQFRSEARWQKAVQHLRDTGVLEGSPRDIGSLVKEVKADIVKENGEEIKEFLFREFGEELLRRSTAGLPEWYKTQLLNSMETTS